MNTQARVPTEVDGLVLSDVFNSFPAGIMVIDRTEKVIAINGFLAEATGITENGVRGQDFREFLNEKGIRESGNPLLVTLHKGEEFKELSPNMLLPSVCSSSFYVSTHALRNTRGEITKAMAVFWDARRQRELEQAVIKAERLAILGQLCTMAMHEIRNCLAVVRGFLQLLKNDLMGTRRASNIDTMLGTLDRAASIIGDFRRFAKPTIPQRKPCSICDLISEDIKLLEEEMLHRGIKASLSSESDLPCVFIDEEQFQQVLLNVFNNAFEAMPDGGEIKIKAIVDRDANSVQIVIEDTGLGMPEDVIARIFEPFFTTKETGTGLGLYISRAIIKNHGGELKIENNPQKGCRVILVLPQTIL